MGAFGLALGLGIGGGRAIAAAAPDAPYGTTGAFDYWRAGQPLARLFPGPEAAAWIVRF